MFFSCCDIVWFLIVDFNSSEKVACNDVNTRGISNHPVCDFVAHTTDKTAAGDPQVHRRRYQELHSSHENRDVQLFAVAHNGFAQVKTYASTEGINPRSFEHLTMIDILVGASSSRTTYPLAGVIKWNRPLEPLVMVSTETIDDEMCSYIQQEGWYYIFCPRLFPKPFHIYKVPHAGQPQ